ncbi:MAG: hypothetical protein WB471_06260 [Nocardioides sp.]
MTLRFRVPVAAVSLAGGVLVGAASAVVHGLGLGLVLSLVATLALVLALPAGWWARLPFGVGWLGVVFYLSNPRPEGDYLIASNGFGYTLLGTGMAIVAFGIITVRPRRPAPSEPARSAADAESVGDPS